MGLEDFPGRLDGKASVYNAGDLGWIPGLGRFLGEGNSNPLQYSCLEKSHGQRSLVQATVHGVAKSRLIGKDPDFGKELKGGSLD